MILDLWDTMLSQMVKYLTQHNNNILYTGSLKKWQVQPIHIIFITRTKLMYGRTVDIGRKHDKKEGFDKGHHAKPNAKQKITTLTTFKFFC